MSALTLSAACTQPMPKMIGDNSSNRTGASIAVTPSTFGVTSITTRGADGSGQVACTEPRPNASLESAIAGNANVRAEQVQALVEAQGAAGSAIGASAEFERVEFLAHGIFGICQLAASGVLKEGEAKALVEAVVNQSAQLKGSSAPTVIVQELPNVTTVPTLPNEPDDP